MKTTETMKIDWNDYQTSDVRNGLKILSMIRTCGYEAFVVGGFVRDLVLGRNPHDFDIATNMPVDDVMRRFKNDGFQCKDVEGRQFGVVVVRYKDVNYEIAHYRSESGYSDKRRPDVINMVETFKEDSARRDLTINSLGIDLEGNVIDHWNGVSDLKVGIIKCVGDPYERFNEDSLRMIRTIRFAACFGFDIDQATLNAIKELKNNIVDPKVNLPLERIHQEMVKTINHSGLAFAEFIKILCDVGIYQLIFNESYVSFETLQALRQANSKVSSLNFAILFAGTYRSNLEELVKTFPFESNDRKHILFVNREISQFEFENIIKRTNGEQLSLFTNHSFYHLKDVYRAYHGGFDSIKDFEYYVKEILKLLEVKKRTGDIIEMLSKSGVVASERKQVLRDVMEWLYHKYPEMPLDSEVERHLICLHNKKFLPYMLRNNNMFK
jgi:tRNA nucleotidyltransferase/poly(A) polymerase